MEAKQEESIIVNKGYLIIAAYERTVVLKIKCNMLASLQEQEQAIRERTVSPCYHLLYFFCVCSSEEEPK